MDQKIFDLDLELGTPAQLQHQSVVSESIQRLDTNTKGTKERSEDKIAKIGKEQKATCVAFRQLFTLVRIQVSLRWCFPPGFNIALDGFDVWDPSFLDSSLQHSLGKQQVSTAAQLCGLTGTHTTTVV